VKAPRGSDRSTAEERGELEAPGDLFPLGLGVHLGRQVGFARAVLIAARLFL
jgi:hypothetical protein